LQELTGKMVAVKLKWGLEYRGFLVATDAYMNLQVRFLTLFSCPLADQALTYFVDRFCAFPHRSSDDVNLYT